MTATAAPAAAAPSPSQSRIDQLSSQLSTLRAELEQSRAGAPASAGAVAPFQGQAPTYAYARPANVPPAATQTTIDNFPILGDFPILNFILVLSRLLLTLFGIFPSEN